MFEQKIEAGKTHKYRDFNRDKQLKLGQNFQTILNFGNGVCLNIKSS